MRTLVRFMALVLLSLFCLSLVLETAAVIIPGITRSTMLIGQGLFRPFDYGMSLFMQPGVWTLIGCVLAVAVILHLLDRSKRRMREHDDSPRQARSAETSDIDQLVHELRHTARRMEERLEALETILLDRANSRS